MSRTEEDKDMPVSLDDLLGKDTETVENNRRFPATHEEFVAERDRGRTQKLQEQPRENNYFGMSDRSRTPISSGYEEDRARAYDNRPRSFERTEVRDFESTGRKYDEYRAQRRPDIYDDYAMDSRIQDMPEQRVGTRSFYEFAARDNSRRSEEELAAKLAYTNEGARPLFDRSNAATSGNMFARQALADITDNRHKVRGRLNAVGKVIVGSFVGAVIVVVSLICAFGKQINNGTAMVPASNVTQIVSEAI